MKPRIYRKWYPLSGRHYWCVSSFPPKHQRTGKIKIQLWEAAHDYVQRLNNRITDRMHDKSILVHVGYRANQYCVRFDGEYKIAREVEVFVRATGMSPTGQAPETHFRAINFLGPIAQKVIALARKELK